MGNDQGKGTRILIICVVVWVIGMLVLQTLQRNTGQMYPYFDASTPDTRYSKGSHEMFVYAGIGWTVTCIALAYFWDRSSRSGM